MITTTSALVAGTEYRVVGYLGPFFRVVRIEGDYVVSIKNGSKTETLRLADSTPVETR